MPLRLDDIEKSGAPISFLGNGEVQVWVGPHSVKHFKESKIPLDGRRYSCSGTIIFNNGLEMTANFAINTHSFDFLERDTVKVHIKEERAWYYLHEEELYSKLQISKEEAFPFTWKTDVPLDYSNPGPYPMKW
jgi:hypothetical protein